MDKNTQAQEEFIQAQHDAWVEESSWPVYEVVITGDETVWVPRADTRYWQPLDETDPQSHWIPLPASDLPDDASLDDEGNVVKTARATVTMHARSEDHAKMLALRDNPDYHTVESVRVIE